MITTHHQPHQRRARRRASASLPAARLAAALAVAAPSIAAGTGCGGNGGESADASLTCEVSRFGHDLFEERLDVLFVIDDSSSMQSVQTALRDNLATFAAVLETLEGGLPSVHIAVVSGDPAADGQLQSEPQIAGCTPPEGSFISDESDSFWTCSDDPAARCGESNYTDPLADTMTCIGALAASPGDRRALLDAAIRAMDDARNPGFRCPEADLAVFFITDGDDASTEPPAHYADLLNALDTPRGVLVGAVAPPDSPRMRAFIDEFPVIGTFVDIAEPDWLDVMVHLATLYSRSTGIPCLEGLDATDLDPANPGLQPDCVATLGGTPDGPLIPPCEMAADDRPAADTPRPCWWIAAQEFPELDMCFDPIVEHDTPGRSTFRCLGTCE